MSYFDEHDVDNDNSASGVEREDEPVPAFSVGAHEDAIRELRQSDVRDVSDPNEECLICFEKFGLYENIRTSPYASLLTMPCGHYFHSKCLHGWLRQAHTCPLCRHKLQPAGDAPPSAGEPIFLGTTDLQTIEAFAPDPYGSPEERYNQFRTRSQFLLTNAAFMRIYLRNRRERAGMGPPEDYGIDTSLLNYDSESGSYVDNSNSSTGNNQNRRNDEPPPDNDGASGMYV